MTMRMTWALLAALCAAPAFAGQSEDEIRALAQEAQRLDPLHVASHLALGRALVGLGRKAEAMTVLQAGIQAAVSGRSNGGGDLVPEMQALLRSIGS